MCISSVQQLNGNSIKFFLSTQTRSSSKALQSKFLQYPSLYCLLFPHFHFFFHSTLHHPTYYYLKSILGNQFPLCLLLLIPVVMDQVLKLSIFPTPSSFLSFYLCPQFSESTLLIEYAAHKRVILFQRYYVATQPEMT